MFLVLEKKEKRELKKDVKKQNDITQLNGYHVSESTDLNLFDFAGWLLVLRKLTLQF